MEHSEYSDDLVSPLYTHHVLDGDVENLRPQLGPVAQGNALLREFLRQRPVVRCDHC